MSSQPKAPGLICLGASAGGLRSLESLVSGLPADLPWPVLIAQHLQADRVSQMPEILARVATMAVREAVEGETPTAGTIYTCPSSQEMGLTIEGRVTLRPLAPGRPQRIDHLFATASYARPDRTIAVVLSGTGSDGAVGSLVVKLNGGTVIAESDESAQHTAMPAAAQRAGSVDVTLPAGAIAAVLDGLSRWRLDDENQANRRIVADIARMITKDKGPDFAHYREGTLRRQASKRRVILGIRTLGEYRDLLADDVAEQEALVRGLLVPVTEFFRDPPAWRAIEDNVIPRLAEIARAGGPVRVWCAGCSTGEEAYTIGILLAENITDRQRVQVLGTDLDPAAVTAAQRGRYDTTRMANLDVLRRERFFEPEENGLRVNDTLRQMVQFRVHDATRDDAPGKFDLIVCRNLLIYFDDHLQALTLQKFHGALAGPRILFLGRSETLQDSKKEFASVARSMRIFRVAGPEDVAEQQDNAALPLDGADAGAPWSGSDGGTMEDPAVFVLVVDDAWRITKANARANALLDEELVGANLLDLFPRWQGSPVHDALRISATTGRSLKVRGVPTPQGAVDVTLERVHGPSREIILIGTSARHKARGSVDPEVREAREDLAATNDELQSANEELAATNEELQATNEELASLNEEFQTTNQTLASTNVELGAVAKNARTATDLINEFLQTWRQAIVACDSAQRITVFNRKAAQLFGLDETCIGRPVRLAALGASESDIARWLDDARSQPFKATVEHLAGKHELTVEQVKNRAGRPLGWVLSWSPTA